MGGILHKEILDLHNMDLYSTPNQCKSSYFVRYSLSFYRNVANRRFQQFLSLDYRVGYLLLLAQFGLC